MEVASTRSKATDICRSVPTAARVRAKEAETLWRSKKRTGQDEKEIGDQSPWLEGQDLLRRTKQVAESRGKFDHWSSEIGVEVDERRGDNAFHVPSKILAGEDDG